MTKARNTKVTVRDEAEGNVAGIWLSLGCGGLSGADVDVMQGTGKCDGELSQAQRPVWPVTCGFWQVMSVENRP